MVRPAVEGDIPSITRIYTHHVLNSVATFELDPPAAEEMSRRWEATRNNGYPYLVYEDASVVGYAYASPYRSRPAYRHTVEDSIYMDPSHSGKGYGAALLEALIGECAALGFQQMIAVIGGGGNTASIRLHQKLGFLHVGVLTGVGYKFGSAVDTVLMQLALPS